MRLFHFSDNARIARFEPRPVQVPSPRVPGREWLNGPLVWAIDDAHQPMYLFPRECPRILVWRTPSTTEADAAEWFGNRSPRMIAHIESAWLPVLKEARLFRYELSPTNFECLDDAGMWVSRKAVVPVGVEAVEDLPTAIRSCDVELRVMPNLVPLRQVWSTSLHVSGIRLRNAVDWPVGKFA